jgi:hypothetical protein
MNSIASPDVSDTESMGEEGMSGTEGSDSENSESVGESGKVDGSRSVHFKEGVHVYQEPSGTSKHSKGDDMEEGDGGGEEEEGTQEVSGKESKKEQDGEGLRRDPYAHRKYVYSLLRDSSAGNEPNVGMGTPKATKAMKFSSGMEGSTPQSAPSGRRLETIRGSSVAPSSSTSHHQSRYGHLHRFTYSLQHSDTEKRVPKTTPRRPAKREMIRKDARHQQMEELLRMTPKRSPKGAASEDDTPWWEK